MSLHYTHEQSDQYSHTKDTIYSHISLCDEYNELSTDYVEKVDVKLIDFNCYNSVTNTNDENDIDEMNDEMNDINKFRIQMFGIDEYGKTYSIIVENFCPFFYVLVPNNWNKSIKEEFIEHIISKIKKIHKSGINRTNCKLVKRKKFYGFDNFTEYCFLKLEFFNTMCFNEVKNLWYSSYENGHKLFKLGYKYNNSYLKLYESNIPAILRYFHITNISPSGWIQISYLSNKSTNSLDIKKKLTYCDFEFQINYTDIIPLNDKEKVVPYKILSFDIEASSSHGDFPIPKKSYRKLAQNIYDYFYKKQDKKSYSMAYYKKEIINILHYAYREFIYREENPIILNRHFDPLMKSMIEKVYPKKKFVINEDLIVKWVNQLFELNLSENESHVNKNSIEYLFDKFEKSQISDNFHSNDDSNDNIDADIDYSDYAADDEDTFSEHDSSDDENEDNNIKSVTEMEIERPSVDLNPYSPTDRNENTDQFRGKAVKYNDREYKKSFSTNGLKEIEDIDNIDYNQYKNKQSESESEFFNILYEIFDNKQTRSEKITKLDKLLSSILPPLEGDIITFIGSTILKYGEKEPYMNHCIVLGDCDNSPNIQMEKYNTEREVLIAWTNFIQRENPDIILGYNIFGFDYKFMYYRAKENYCLQEFLQLSRNRGEICSPPSSFNKYVENDYKLTETKLKISSGEYLMEYVDTIGRIQIDLLYYFRRERNLSSYKLDDVAGTFISDNIKSIEHKIIEIENNSVPISIICTKNLTGLTIGSFIHIEEIQYTSNYYNNGEKFQILEINLPSKSFIIKGQPILDFTNKTFKWGLAKDDVSPQDIFKMTRGSLYERSIIAKYCIQDCNIVQYLSNKIDLITDFVEMASICSVPIKYLITRGQGIKLFSLLAKFCRENKTLIPVFDKSDDGGYEGAIVLPPKCNLYLDMPIAVNDFNSLYPSSMISENISHDSKVWTKEYDIEGNLINENGLKNKHGDYIYDNLPDYDYVNITYDNYKYVRDPKSPKKKAKKVKCGYKICRFVQFLNNKKAIIPSILEKLLKARKDTRELQKITPDDFMKNILDIRQQNYKKCANSVYGQCGASTSMFYEKDVAASTTAIGRLNITYAKRIIEECYNNTVFDTNFGYKVITNAECIYGDTDSIFYTFNLKNSITGEPIKGKDALQITIDLAQKAGELASSFLKRPHNWEYEKTFMPFCMLSKKKYVGILYETDINKGKRKEMGIVLKRRDNAPIVKDVYGGVIDILLKKMNIQEAIDFLKLNLKSIVDKKIPIDKLIITKQLRSDYKNPLQIAHKVLADRIGEREPGNAPKPGDRIDFVYIQPIQKPKKNEKILQGNCIENPKYIIQNNLKIDYSHYITNQILEPIQQVFSLVLENIWRLQNKKPAILAFKNELKQIKKIAIENKWPEEKLDQQIKKIKREKVVQLLFQQYLTILDNQKNCVQSIDRFFVKK